VRFQTSFVAKTLHGFVFYLTYLAHAGPYRTIFQHSEGDMHAYDVNSSLNNTVIVHILHPSWMQALSSAFHFQTLVIYDLPSN
jgi:hypothetical protein